MLVNRMNEPGANTEERVQGDALIVRVTSRRLDAPGSRLLGRRLEALIYGGHRLMALEMSNVEFIDSSGLSVLVLVEQRLGNHGGFVITSPSKTVMSILRLTRLAKVFRIFPDEQTALTALLG